MAAGGFVFAMARWQAKKKKSFYIRFFVFRTNEKNNTKQIR